VAELKGADLLRALGGTPPAGRVRPAPAQGLGDFGAMLESARRGELASEPVRVEPGTGIELSDEQLGVIGAAADRAAAAGASKALVVLDGVGYVVDMLTRSVTQAFDLAAGEVAVDVDAVIKAGQPAGDETAPVTGPWSPAPPSIARALRGERPPGA